MKKSKKIVALVLSAFSFIQFTPNLQAGKTRHKRYERSARSARSARSHRSEVDAAFKDMITNAITTANAEGIKLVCVSACHVGDENNFKRLIRCVNQNNNQLLIDTLDRFVLKRGGKALEFLIKYAIKHKKQNVATSLARAAVTSKNRKAITFLLKYAHTYGDEKLSNFLVEQMLRRPSPRLITPSAPFPVQPEPKYEDEEGTRSDGKGAWDESCIGSNGAAMGGFSSSVAAEPGPERKMSPDELRVMCADISHIWEGLSTCVLPLRFAYSMYKDAQQLRKELEQRNGFCCRPVFQFRRPRNATEEVRDYYECAINNRIIMIGFAWSEYKTGHANKVPPQQSEVTEKHSAEYIKELRDLHECFLHGNVKQDEADKYYARVHELVDKLEQETNLSFGLKYDSRIRSAACEEIHRIIAETGFMYSELTKDSELK